MQGKGGIYLFNYELSIYVTKNQVIKYTGPRISKGPI